MAYAEHTTSHSFWMAFANAAYETSHPWQLWCDWQDEEAGRPQTLMYHPDKHLFYRMGESRATVTGEPIHPDVLAKQAAEYKYRVKLYAVERGEHRKTYFENL